MPDDRGAVKPFPISLDVTGRPGVIAAVTMNRAHLDLRARMYDRLRHSLFLLLQPVPLGVIGANMQRKLSVALQLEVAHHFIERSAAGRTRWLEPPATIGAAKTPKTLLLNPH